jgi:thymidylate kinase
MSIVQALDSSVRDRVLIFGSLPPEGRDIDVLARPAEHRTIAGKLRADGFLNSGDRWVTFEHGTATSIELVASEAWSLPPEEVHALFAEARPVDGLERLVRPAPPHVLLIAARRLVRTGDFSEKQRAKVEAAQREDSRCWEAAADHAESWRAEPALALLRRAVDEGAHVSRRERARAIARESGGGWTGAARTYIRLAGAVARRTRRGMVVSISGCDGAGKSSQTQALQRALEKAGVEAVVVWSPLGQFPFLDVVADPIKNLLRFLKLGPFRHESAHSEVRSIMSSRTDASSPVGALLKNLWTTVIAFLNGVSQRHAVSSHLRRGRVVIFDRSALDAIVLMRFLYGEGHGFRFQRWVLRTLSPCVSLGYFLDVSPETLLARKEDWWTLADLGRHANLYREECARFGVKRLDGARPQDEISTMIATETWLTVTGKARPRDDAAPTIPSPAASR